MSARVWCSLRLDTDRCIKAVVSVACSCDYLMYVLLGACYYILSNVYL